MQITLRDETEVIGFAPQQGLLPKVRRASPALLQALTEAGMLVRDAQGRRCLRDLAALQFLRGGWLDLAVHDALRQ